MEAARVAYVYFVLSKTKHCCLQTQFLHTTRMLGIILSHNQLAAGTANHDDISYVYWEGKDQTIKDLENPEKELPELLGTIFDKARNASWFTGSEESPCPVFVASATNEDVSQLSTSLHSQFESLGIKDFRLAGVDSLGWPFVMGAGTEIEEGEKVIVLEGLGKMASWIELESRKSHRVRNIDEVGGEFLFENEKTSKRKLTGFGPEAGKEKVLATLMKQFSTAGLTLDAETQTSLGEQVTQVPIPGTYNLSRETGNIIIQAEATFDAEELSELMLGDYQMLRPQLKKDVLHAAGVSKVWLMGPFFHHPKFISFLKDECRLDAELRIPESGSVEEIFNLTLKGIASRNTMILEAEQIKADALARKKEAEEKKAAIAAELKMKDERDQFLQEIKDICKDPAKKEEYESNFVSRGESLGIPDLVIKWNITEAISRVELVQESEEIGMDLPEQPEVESPETGAKAEEKATEPAPVEKVAPIEKKPEPKPEPVAEVKPESKPAPKVEVKKPEPRKVEVEPVLEPVLATSGAPAAVAEAVKTQVKTKPSRKRDQVSLEDIFTWKGELEDAEFVSKKATFHQDSDVKVVKILSADLTSNGESIGNFRRVYEKELAYFGEMSEISESRDGMYFYRKYIERQTLRDFAVKNGLANKKNIEDLSSTDLKFILTLLKEVQELPVSHGNLTAENILIINKRKWNLSKDLEVKFVGFHSQDVSEEETIAQAHAALGSVIGEDVYEEFKEKFQL